jgi:Flp pilus assembly protein CpaB
MTVAAVTAILAGLLLLVFINRYRSSVNDGAQPASVLVADRLIPKGTSASAVVSGGFLRPATVTTGDRQAGALADARALNGQVATRDVAPGQQITAADFAVGADPLRGELGGRQRAISIPLDSSHGLMGDVRANDHVDVYVGFNTTNSANGQGTPVLSMLFDDVLVLKVPVTPTSGSATNGNVILRATDAQAAKLAFASDNGKLWLVLRPPTGAAAIRPSTITLESLLAGTKSIQTSGGGR